MDSPLKELKKLRNNVMEGDGSTDHWLEIVNALKDPAIRHPNHMVFIIEDLQKMVRAGKSKQEICILDHGCGGGITVMYLAALGYTNIYGIDIAVDRNIFLNDFFKNRLGFKRDIFVEYEENRVPLEDNSVDYIFSQEVLEHVHPDLIDEYLKEEKRVFKNGGMARHSFPVRNGFHESHTKTLVLHWLLPRPLFNRVIGAFDKERFDRLEKNLFLNWAGYYEKRFLNFLGDYSDQTARSLQFDFKAHEYDADRLTFVLRKLARYLAQNKITKSFARRLFAYFAEKEYLVIVEK